MDSFDITVLVPIYNVEKYVKKCLDSLERQTYKNFEVWAVDDGSPDNSKDIVKQYAKKDKRIKLITKNNGGYGSVLQLGVNGIQTKYFIICDPDDWLSSDALEKLHSYAEQNDLDITVGDKYNVYTQDGEKEYIKTFSRDLNIKPKLIYTDPDEIQKFSFGLVSPHAKLYKTEITRNIVFQKKVSYTDFVLYMLALSKAKRVAYYNEALAYYLTDRPGNTSTDIRTSIVKDYSIGWKSVFDQIKDFDKYSILLYRLYGQFRYILSEYLRVSKNNSYHGYDTQIFEIIVKLQKYKGKLAPFIKGITAKLFFIGIMNRKFYKLNYKIYRIIKTTKYHK